jgi:hypothetical protein
MAHNFVKYGDSRICTACGDEKGSDPERRCPFSKQNVPKGSYQSLYLLFV